MQRFSRFFAGLYLLSLTFGFANGQEHLTPVSPANARALRGPETPIDPATSRVAGAIEGEQLNAQPSAGQARRQAMGNLPEDCWSGDAHLWWTGARPGGALTITLPGKQGKGSLELVLTCAKDYGIVQLAFNGKTLGTPIDLFHSEVITTGVLTFDELDFNRQGNTLEVQIVGANPDAVPAYMFGLDYVRLRRQGETFPEPADGIKPTAADGRPLNLDFETGTLADWTAKGKAFANQPIKGDTVLPRRGDMKSGHRGDYWIGGFERYQDPPTGTLTSAPFKVTHPYATFLANGGPHAETRVELVRKDTGKPFFQISGQSSETLRQVIVDLRRHQGQEIYIRLVDDHRGGWGHVNFDHFRFHATAPGRPTPTKVQLVADEYPHAGLEAEAAVEAMTLPEGFRVSLCASEPEVKQPIAMALDDRGRLWVAEAYEYPRRAKEGEGRDRILIFEDQDGDGKFDQRKVFTEGLNLVSGLEVGFGGVWVGAAPYLLFIPDRNRDDVPDGKPEVLLDGWGYQDTHETLNAFIWGPDGWLYGCHGVFTHSRVGKPGTPAAERVPINAGIWRYHPTRHVFEVFAHGTSNPWGVDFNDYGQAFCTACVIPHLFHIIQGARYHRQAGQHFNPHTYQDIRTIADHLHYLGATPHSGNNKSDEAGGGHAHAGAMIYLGGAWPEEYRGQIFMNNIHGQRVNMDILKPSGSGYVGSHSPDFLLTGDRASQILNLRYGPDGQVYIIDWYDMQACHLNDPKRHDRSNGRIYKVTYGDPAATSVDLHTLSDLELAKELLNANDWYVRHTRRVLQERAAKRPIAADARDFLTSTATNHAEDTRRLRALWALHVTGSLEPVLLRQTLTDASPYVRGWAVQLGFDRPAPALTPSDLAKLAVSDDSPVVRLYVASAAQQVAVKDRWDIVAALAAHAEDAADHNLPLMIWYASEPLADVDPERALALGLTAGKTMPRLREFMFRRIGSTDSKGALAILIRGLKKADTAEIQGIYLNALRTALQGQRQVRPPEEWPEVYAALRKSDDARIRLETLALSLKFGDANAKNAIMGQVQDATVPTEIRQRGLQALLEAKDPGLALLLQQLVKDAAVRKVALMGLAQYDDPNTPALLLKLYPNLPPEEKRAVLATLCSRVAYGRALLEGIQAQQLPGSDLTADLVRQLEYFKDDALTRQLKTVWGRIRPTPADKIKLIARYKNLMRQPDQADRQLGRALFARTCMQCHQLYGVGDNLGPDLTGSNRADLDYLLSNIVDPSAVMAKEYQQSIFYLFDGRVITGIVKAETAKAVTVRTADQTIVLPKQDIDQRVLSDQSMMPENQLLQLKEHEIRGLLAYLGGNQQVPMLATRDNASQLFNGKDLSGWSGDRTLWSVEGGAIVGRTSGLKKNTWLVSDLAVADFRLSLAVRLLGNAGNSGIQFRSSVHDGEVHGYQADIGPGWWGKLYEEHGRGLLWDKSGEGFLQPDGWNNYVIEARGSRLRTFINGHLCVDLDDPAGAARGIIALQLHSGGKTEVRFRNLKLEVLERTSDPK